MISFKEFLLEGPVQRMSHKELIKHIERKGWKLERSSKHLIYSHPSYKEKIAIPHGRGDASPGIIRQALSIT